MMIFPYRSTAERPPALRPGRFARGPAIWFLLPLLWCASSLYPSTPPPIGEILEELESALETSSPHDVVNSETISLVATSMVYHFEPFEGGFFDDRWPDPSAGENLDPADMQDLCRLRDIFIKDDDLRGVALALDLEIATIHYENWLRFYRSRTSQPLPSPLQFPNLTTPTLALVIDAALQKRGQSSALCSLAVNTSSDPAQLIEGTAPQLFYDQAMLVQHKQRHAFVFINPLVSKCEEAREIKTVSSLYDLPDAILIKCLYIATMYKFEEEVVGEALRRNLSYHDIFFEGIIDHLRDIDNPIEPLFLQDERTFFDQFIIPADHVFLIMSSTFILYTRYNHATWLLEPVDQFRRVSPSGDAILGIFWSEDFLSRHPDLSIEPIRIAR